MPTTKPFHWYCLLGAIILEVGGTTVMKLAQGWSFAHAGLLGLALMWLAIGLSYYLLALSTTGLPVGVAFAFWEGLGLTLITLSGMLFLGEALTFKRMLGLVCVLAGALLVNHGTGHGHGAARPAGSAAPEPDAGNTASRDKGHDAGLPKGRL